MMDTVSSILILSAAILLGGAICLIIVNYRYPSAIRRALNLYASANVAVAAGDLTVTLFERDLPQLGQTFDLGIAAIGTCLYYLALRSLQERPHHLRAIGTLYLVALACILYFCGVEHDVSMGLATLCLLDVVLFGLMARDLLMNFAGRGRAHLMMGVSTIIYIVGLAVWAVSLVVEPHQAVLIDHFGEIGSYAIGMSCLSAALGSINFLLLCNDEFNTLLLTMVATDPLTNVANRRRLMERGEEEIARALRYNTPLTVVMIDLDHFKALNDTHGHAAGDHALRNTAQACVAALRDIDLVSRSGGEEFAVLLPQTPLARGMEVAERLRLAVASLAIKSGDATIKITASLGVAEFTRDDRTIDHLLARSDRALYRSKAEGRNRVSHDTAGTVVALPPGTRSSAATAL